MKTDGELLEEALMLIDELNEKIDNIKTPITKESLEKWGMKLTGDPGCPMDKVLGESEDGKISIGVVRYHNVDEFALSSQDGIFYLNISCIEDLVKLESMLVSYEPNY